MDENPTRMRCGACGVAIPPDHPYTWCAECGEPLPEELRAALRNVYTGAAAGEPTVSQPDASAGGISAAAFEEAYQALVTPPRVQTGKALLVGTLGLFVIADLVWNGSWGATLWLVAVLLLHELGHFAGMRWFGYQDVRMFFIPLVGAAVSGRPTTTSAWKDGIVTLLGPLPGIVLGLALSVVIAGGLDIPWLHQLAWLLVAINAFNLLPLGPLDGGRLFQSVIFSRHRYLELASGVVTVVLLFVLGLSLRAGFLSLIAIWVAVLVRARYRAASGVLWLRRTQGSLPADPSALDPDQRFALYTAARTVVPDGKENDAPALTGAMQMMLEAFRPRPSLPISLALLGAWAAGLMAALVAVAVLAVTQPAVWAEYDCPELGVSAEFPMTPVGFPLRTVPSPVGEVPAIACSANHRGAATYSIVLFVTGDTVDDRRRQLWLSSLGPGVQVGAPIRADGLDAVDVERAPGSRSRLVFAGSMVFELQATGARAEDAGRFFTSFHRKRGTPQ